MRTRRRSYRARLAPLFLLFAALPAGITQALCAPAQSPAPKQPGASQSRPAAKPAAKAQTGAKTQSSSLSARPAQEKAGVKPQTTVQPARAALDSLTWLTDLKGATKLAKSSDKMILVDIYTDWCGWCHKLDRDVYTDPEVIKFVNSRFVCLKLDAEDGGPGQEFAQQYEVNGFPCIMVLDASGKLRGVFYGYRPAGQFPDAVRSAMEKMGS